MRAEALENRPYSPKRKPDRLPLSHHFLGVNPLMQNSQIPTTVKEAPESFSLAQQVPLEETSHESLGAGLAVFGLVLVLKRGPYGKNRTGTYPKMK